MSIYKRRSTWWIRFTTPSGQLVRTSAKTENKQAAQELHDKLKAASWDVEKLGHKPSWTWDHAANRWLQEMQHKKSYQDDVGILRWLQPRLTLKPLREISRDLIGQIAEEKRKESSPSRANRVLALIRAILRRSETEWEWLDKAPAVRMYREPKHRIRWLTPSEFNRLLRELPEHQREVAIFAVATGLRQSNVMKLERSQVNLEGKTLWIHGDQAKGGKDIHYGVKSRLAAPRS